MDVGAVWTLVMPDEKDDLDAIGIPGSPWLTTEEAARYLRFPSVRAFYAWLDRNNIPKSRRGRVLLFERRILDAYIRGELWTKRRR